MKPAMGTRKVPSVLGGFRPQPNDPGADAFRRVQAIRADVEKAREVLARHETALIIAEDIRNNMRTQCGNCDRCSACIG